MEWLIELLKTQGVEEAKITSIVDSVKKTLPEHFVAKADFNSKIEEVKNLKGQVTERDTQLETLKKTAGVSDELKAQIKKLQDDNTAAATKFDAELSQMKLSHAVETHLLNSKAKNIKAAKALLDMSRVKFDGDNLIGLTDQIEALKKNEAYLFGETVPVGTQPGSHPQKGDSTVNPWKKETLNLTLQGKLVKENPTLAQQMMAEAKK